MVLGDLNVGEVSDGKDFEADCSGKPPVGVALGCASDLHGHMSFGGGWSERDGRYEGLCPGADSLQFPDPHALSRNEAIDLSAVGEDWRWVDDGIVLGLPRQITGEAPGEGSEDAPCPPHPMETPQSLGRTVQAQGVAAVELGVHFQPGLPSEVVEDTGQGQTATNPCAPSNVERGLGLGAQLLQPEPRNDDGPAARGAPGGETGITESPVRIGALDTPDWVCDIQAPDRLIPEDGDAEGLPMPENQKRKSWRKMSEKVKNSVQRPPDGPFSRVDLVWARKSIGGNGKRRDTKTATIPWDRLDDFVEGEMCSRQHPCTFVELSRQCMKVDDRKQTRAESAKQEIRYFQFCCFEVPVLKK